MKNFDPPGLDCEVFRCRDVADEHLPRWLERDRTAAFPEGPCRGRGLQTTRWHLKHLRVRASVAVCLLSASLWAVSMSTGARELHSYAIVNDDGSLLIQGKTVWLHGVYMPDTRRTCVTYINPVRCGSRAVLALAFKNQGFLKCYHVITNQDKSINAYCYANSTNHYQGEDLGAYLIERGLAVASPEAPFEYFALERIARHNNRGVWGFYVDSIDDSPFW